jgi:hypothetical protein
VDDSMLFTAGGMIQGEINDAAVFAWGKEGRKSIEFNCAVY